MTRIQILGGRVIDPALQVDRVANLLIEDGRIVGLDQAPRDDAETIDAGGLIVAPGLIDIHTELREPGLEEDETIRSGTAAALAGGFTSIACLPNTDPPIDTQASVEFIRHQAALAGHCNVFVIACVSKNRQGEELAEIGTLSQAGAVAFTDADAPLHNSELLRRALEYCLMFDKPILNHPESLRLSKGGVMHEGQVSLVLGIAGIPAEAEDVMTSRDLRLAEATGGRLHLMNISSSGSIDLIRRAKARGVRITAEVLPWHFALADDLLRTFDTNYKIKPPLRSQEHIEACIAGLVDGTLDVIASGHAPRASEKKMRELDHAPFGVVSLETTLGMVVTHLIEPGHLDWPAALAKLTINPAQVLGLDRGTLAVGAPADVTLIDPQVRWQVDSSRFLSHSANTPVEGVTLVGRADTVLVDGQVRYRQGRLVKRAAQTTSS